MNNRITNMDDLTDSVEIIQESKENYFILGMYGFIILIVIGIIFSCFYKVDDVVNTTGMIRANEDGKVMSVPYMVTVDQVYFKNGDYVKKGEKILKLKSDEIELQNKTLDTNKETYSKKLENLKKLKSSIEEGNCLFTDKEKESYYINQYNTFSNDINILKNNYENIRQQLVIAGYNPDDSSKINETLNTKQKSLESKKQTLASLKQQKEKQNNNLSIINKTISEDEQISSSDTSNDNDLEMQISSINDEISELTNDLYTINSFINERDNFSQNLEKTKSEKLSSIEADIMECESQLKSLSDNDEVYKDYLDKETIVAYQDGYLNLPSNIIKGATLEVGSQLGSIVKDSTADSNNYIVQLVIDDKDIADLKVGSAVKLKVNSISYKEYGTIDGEIMRVSADVSIDQETGKSFYIAEASVNKESLKNSKGEEKEIKAGMQCQVQLLKDKKTLFKWILDRTDLFSK